MLVTSTASAGTKTAYFKCASVISEGGFDNDYPYSFSTPELTVTAANGTRTSLISLRSRTTFNSITNRSMLQLGHIELVNTGSNPIFYELVLGATFSAAPTFSNINTNYSATEYSSTNGTYSALTNGFVIESGYVTATNQIKNEVSHAITARNPLGLDRAGAVRALGTVTLLVTGLGGTSTCRASMTIKEIR